MSVKTVTIKSTARLCAVHSTLIAFHHDCYSLAGDKRITLFHHHFWLISFFSEGRQPKRQSLLLHRNLTNEQLRTIGEAGGFVGLNFYPPFVAEKASVTMDDLIRQLTHMLDWAGEDAVGLGSDFDGIDITPTDLRQVEDMACFLERLEREFGEKTAAKIREENFLRVAKQVWK